VKQQLRILSYLASLTTIFVLIGTTSVYAGSRQEHVHQMAHSVMPFDISKTVHIFKMTESGGVQRVIAKDPGATDQIELIQQHLRHEARMFQQGNYSDPAKLHGTEMPGLKDLEAGASHIKVSYAAVPSGAEIRFETTDLHLLTALHRWFGAQLSEHGADARAE
jgi:ABC-type lipoprotein release transport system permease subunit